MHQKPKLVGSCLLKASVVECQTMPTIDTKTNILINSTLDRNLHQQSGNSQLIFEDRPSTVNQLVVPENIHTIPRAATWNSEGMGGEGNAVWNSK